jgi:hypothetical protein
VAPRLNPRPSCLCGCGEPAVGRSRYAPEHRAILGAARRRLREARSYSYKRGILFDLDLEHVLELVARSWPADEGLALRRLDRSEGFVHGNVELAPVKGGRPRTATVSRLQRRLARLAQRADVAGQLYGDDLARLLARQGGLCAISGRPLQLAARLVDPRGIALLPLDPGQPVAVDNAILVCTSVAQAVGASGVHALVDLARDIVRTQDGTAHAQGAPDRRRRR